MPVTSALGKLIGEDHEFKASWGYIKKPCLTNNANNEGDERRGRKEEEGKRR
jgi:hypothetical protein